MISVRFHGKPWNITVIQAYAPTSNAEEAEVERFYEDLLLLLLLLLLSRFSRVCTTRPFRTNTPKRCFYLLDIKVDIYCVVCIKLNVTCINVKWPILSDLRNVTGCNVMGSPFS